MPPLVWALALSLAVRILDHVAALRDQVFDFLVFD